MPLIDLTRYIVASTGTWTDPSKDTNLFGFSVADTVSPARLLLRWAGDFVALAGPLTVRVTVQAENMTVPLALVGNMAPDPAAYVPAATAGDLAGMNAGGAAYGYYRPGMVPGEAALAAMGGASWFKPQASTIYSYTLEIPAGQAWPFSLSDQIESLRLRRLSASRHEQLGNNLGYRVVIEPAFDVAKLVPVTSGADLPCDFAVADQPNTAQFFPAGCEPCNGTVVGLPPSGAVTLITPPADGGCVRTRFFNGMFITREDLETEQRYQRLKSKLHNRASGAGVVWGLAVGKQGNQICVLPGYGVDCCGNDLALTTTYKVDIAALLADPAASMMARQRGAQRMSLLLEYIECPSDPRPVHGDACAPDASRCEMSRIRESVRLRLVPPRDCAPSSVPIKRFLDEVRALQAQFPVDEAPVLALDQAPFRMRVTATRAPGAEGTAADVSVTVRPSASFDSKQQFSPLVHKAITQLTVTITPDPLWTFVDGTLNATAGKGIVVSPKGEVQLSLKDGLQQVHKVTFDLPPGHARGPDALQLKMAWRAQNALATEDGVAPTGQLMLAVALDSSNQFSTVVSVELAESEIKREPLDLAAAPCGTACGPSQPSVPTPPPPPTMFNRPPSDNIINRGLELGGNMFAGTTAAEAKVWGAGTNTGADPTPVLPWLHPDPQHPSSPADPKVLLLAALGGWLSQMLVRERAGTADEVQSTRRELAQGIYRAAWLLLFGAPERADPAVLGGTLKRLFQSWCHELLWKGPECCGDPHGVVIGCAVVEGGTIQSVDPFGGRRHVVHYPLLEHWGAQFGIAPLDVTASHFFSALCCVGALPAVNVARPNLSISEVRIGGGILLFGDPAHVQSAMAKRQIVAKRTVATAEMIASVIAATSTKPPSSKSAGTQQFNALMLGDLVGPNTVMLLTPA